MKKPAKAKQKKKIKLQVPRLRGRKGFSLGWLWPVAGFAALAALSWQINVQSGHWPHKLEKDAIAGMGPTARLVDVHANGRDLVLSGRVRDEQTRQDAIAAARKVSGVRGVVSKIDVGEAAPNPRPKPVRTPSPPKITQYQGQERRPLLTGTWPQETGGILELTLAGRTYVAGKDSELSIKGGSFTFKPANDLPDGIYDIELHVRTPDQVLRDKSRGEVVIDTTAPLEPTVGVSAGGSLTPVLRGSWDKANAKDLVIVIDGKTYRLGSSPALVSDAEGNWTLTISSPMKAGIYDVAVVSVDEFGNLSRDISENELVVGNVASAVTATDFEEGKVRPVAAGRWAEGRGQSLEIGLNGKTYRLGRDRELTSDGQGNWSLNPGLGVPDGEYVLAIQSIDDTGTRETFAINRKITVDNTSPAAPSVQPYSGTEPPKRLSGTWAVGDATGLIVRLNGKKYVLGKDKELTASENGGWTLALGQALEPGTYDVSVLNHDKLGNASRDQTTGEIVIKPEVAVVLPPWFAIKEREQLILRGTVPGNVRIVELFAYAQENVSDLEIDDRSILGEAVAPDGWFDAAKAAISNLSNLRTGVMRIEGGVVTVSGDALDEDNDKALRTNLSAGLPSGFAVEFDVTVAEGPDTADCQDRFDTVMGSNDLQFEDGSAKFLSSAEGVLEQLANIAAECQRHLIEISAHTDSSGSFAANMKLSRERASAVAKFLNGRHDGKLTLKTAGFGETQPIFSNKTELGRKSNRRIEITVSQ
ncbi:MAG: OmpA family protein [Hyphomicrobiales bacterium]